MVDEYGYDNAKADADYASVKETTFETAAPTVERPAWQDKLDALEALLSDARERLARVEDHLDPAGTSQAIRSFPRDAGVSL
jgi:hypothetical protein